MSLSITSTNAKAGCSLHRNIVIDDEGVSRTFVMALAELDAFLAQFESPAEMKKYLVLLWAAYRRSQGRAITGVTIA